MEPNTQNNNSSDGQFEAQQASSPPVLNSQSSDSKMSPNVAGALCYFLSPLSGIYFFITEKDNKFVRFHAFQSIIFGSLFIILFTILPYYLFFVRQILSLVVFVCWLLLMYKAYNNEEFELPIIGAIAKKQANK